MAPDPSPNISEQSDKPTGFFSLARELRDKIYDMIREDRCKKFGDVKFDFRVAIPEKRLVSRQFTSKYDEKSAVNTFVRVFDPFNECTSEKFPRLAVKSRSLELSCASDDDFGKQFLPFQKSPIEPSLGHRLSSLQELVSHLPELKEVHIELLETDMCVLRSMVGELITCSALTSFSIRSAGFILVETTLSGLEGKGTRTWLPWSSTEETVNFAIWSREHGFLVDNADENKAKHEVKAAIERHLRREAARMQNEGIAVSLSDTPVIFVGRRRTVPQASLEKRVPSM